MTRFNSKLIIRGSHNQPVECERCAEDTGWKPFNFLWYLCKHDVISLEFTFYMQNLSPNYMTLQLLRCCICTAKQWKSCKILMKGKCDQVDLEQQHKIWIWIAFLILHDLKQSMHDIIVRHLSKYCQWETPVPNIDHWCFYMRAQI